MPRNSGWGETEQKNSLNLVEALLSHADESLELDDALKTAVQVEWVSANQLRVTGKEKQKTGNRIVDVGTRKEHLVTLIKKTGKRLELGKRQGSQQDNELDAIQTVIDRLRDLEVLKEDPNNKKTQGYWKFTLTLQHQTESRDRNLAVVKQKWQEKTASNVPELSPIPDKNIDWREICDQVLETQQLRRQATAQQYELNIYVPLGLMERPKTPNPRTNAIGEDSRSQKEPELQIVQTYKDDAFFQKAIAENRTEKGKHIAIIGEPGAGKTTLLGELAERLPKNSPDFPICIRLADLRESTIEDYLLDNWLKKALQFIDADAENVTPEIRKALKQLFRQGKVWLLLDAVDEMAAESPVQALAKIREQLTDWVGKARVVLTCRLNVWDAAISNTLTNFDTYKTLEFEPDDVDEFIHQWFEQASQDEKRRNSGNENFWHSQGKRLQQELKAPGKERIRELVRNPLRLSMLCQSWCVPEQDLPSTKAALYEQFTTYFFEWKQEEFQKKHRVLKETDKKQIQQALAKLALAAMESANRFRIEQDFAIEQMEEQWFNLAGELGWLVLVDRDTRTKKPVYAFFHPTFQEYFVALAIDDWDFFLPRNHIDKPVLGKRYRIFEPQWKQVILLWLGREDVERKHKEEFIQALLQFDDGCGKFSNIKPLYKSFYESQAYFLAIVGSSEVRHFVLSDKFVGEIVSQSLCDSDLLREVASTALVQLDRTQVINSLVQLIQFIQKWNPHDKLSLCYAAELLGKIDLHSDLALNTLLNLSLANRYNDYSIRIQAIKSLGKICKYHPKAISYLMDYSKYAFDKNIRLEAISNLIDEVNISAPIIADALPLIVKDLLELSKGDNYEYSLDEPIFLLEKIARSSSIAVDALIQLIRFPNRHNFFLVAYSLGKIDEGKRLAVDALVSVIQNDWWRSAYSGRAASILWKIGATPSCIVVDTLVRLIQNCEYEDTCWQAAYSLGTIDQGNPIAIDTLITLIQNSQDKNIRAEAAASLGLIDKGNYIAINTLTKLIHNYWWDVYTRSQSAYYLLQIEPGNSLAINTLMKEITSYSSKEWNRRSAADKLKIILRESEIKQVIAALNHYLSANQFKYNHERFNACYELLWHYAQTLPYPEFYQAWHSDKILKKLYRALFHP
ncbi:MAG: HEAT repeat domain-containing protein [Microcoleus sp. PH2017_01_SCD_O_A]|uniref:NACHT domain-containing protein n=1 Tax=unclassified Microcoleus TaxID=2642155 RepID=UPI001E16EDC7|nr:MULTISPECIES: NACHT domain-containing protein [unclassified Microcoleus]MCC3425470.1 HEAT repeat domain-containing protein [Microcoleus sp. PH2017_01_SCD_O_A]MCC3571963.1 HEAT repeat domain-containing protein [Microcoleus sp. PH2017_34_RAT_O_A]MCC3609573.1 HEAT repeat domain-containing protein [Microcoleus sp. PH2017_40_RAT_O_B]